MYQFFVRCNGPISLCVVELEFSYEVTTKKLSSVIHEGKILQQLENVKIYKDLYEKPLKLDWWQRLFSHTSPFRNERLFICLTIESL